MKLSFSSTTITTSPVVKDENKGVEWERSCTTLEGYLPARDEKEGTSVSTKRKESTIRIKVEEDNDAEKVVEECSIPPISCDIDMSFLPDLGGPKDVLVSKSNKENDSTGSIRSLFSLGEKEHKLLMDANPGVLPLWDIPCTKTKKVQLNEEAASKMKEKKGENNEKEDIKSKHAMITRSKCCNDDDEEKDEDYMEGFMMV